MDPHPRITVKELLDGMGVFSALISPQGAFVEVNRLALDISGYDLADLRNLLCWEWDGFAYDPAVAAVIQRQFAECRAGKTANFEIAAKLISGDILDVEITFHPLLDAYGKLVQVLATAVDLTPRRLVEQKLRSKQLQLEAVIHSAPAILIELDAAGVVTLLEGGQLADTGIVSEGVVGRSFFEVFSEFPDAVAAVREALAGTESSLLFEGYGSTFDVRYRPLFDLAGMVSGVIGVAVNVTERDRTQRELRRAHSELAHAGRLSVLGQMTASIAHDLNQPLTSISTLAYAAQQTLAEIPGERSAPLRDMLATIESQALRAGEIIRRFRDFSRKGKTLHTKCSLTAIVEEVLAMSEPFIRALDVRCCTNVPVELPAISVDRVQIQQVLFNLIRNALEAMESSPVGERRLCIAAVCRGAQMEIVIRDSGPGIPDSVRPRLFEPWDSSKPSGLGLGLAISRSLVEAHQGTLELADDSQTGAAFVVRLPIHHSGAIDDDALGNRPPG
jgi:two-component system sensor kinase FixL